jgi:hypothetical protein
MTKKGLLIAFLLANLIGHPVGFAEDKQTPVFKEIPELKSIQPKQPAKIKLKRYVQGGYSWEISGFDTEEIIKIDKRLRSVLGQEEGRKSE